MYASSMYSASWTPRHAISTPSSSKEHGHCWLGKYVCEWREAQTRMSQYQVGYIACTRSILVITLIVSCSMAWLATFGWLLVFGRGSLASPCGYSWNIGFETLLLCTICPRRQFDQCVERNLHPRTLLLRHIMEVRVYASQNRLVGDDDNVLTAFQLHNDRL